MAAILPFLEDDNALDTAGEADDVQLSGLGGAPEGWPVPPPDMAGPTLIGLGWRAGHQTPPFTVGTVFPRMPAAMRRSDRQDASDEPKRYWVVVSAGEVDESTNHVTFYARNLVTGKREQIKFTTVAALTSDWSIWMPPDGLYVQPRTKTWDPAVPRDGFGWPKIDDRWRGVVLDAREQGLDDSDGRWYASCDRHGTNVVNATKALAQSSARDTRQFCDACREESETGNYNGIPEGEGFAGVMALGAPRAASWAEQDKNPLRAHVEANHANMTRFVWARRLVEDHLSKCNYWLVREKDGYFFKISPPLPNDVVPWKLMGTDDGEKLRAQSEGRSPGRDTFRLIGEGNGKMECPAWDLPAGSTSIGGTCPGAAAGQTAVAIAIRKHHLTPDSKFLRAIPPGSAQPVPFREAAAICSACYAGEGNFGYSEQLAGNLLRYAWTRDLIRTPDGLREWVEIMAEAITSIRAAVAEDDYSDQMIRPFRVHSSGDFFSPDYAKAWMHLANRVAEIEPQIKFWCPTRTWAAPRGAHGSAFNWGEILSILRQENLVVRPSAFHVGDPAPGPLADHPAASKGTTALVGPLGPGDKPGVFHAAFPEAIVRGDEDARADHNCPVYALKKADEAGSCGAARCRVCWTRPDVSVNYALH
jgi:hypothetical protein